MERTCLLAEPRNDGSGVYESTKPITCRNVGQWADGRMVWQDDEGEQYMLFRVNGKYYFVHA